MLNWNVAGILWKTTPSENACHHAGDHCQDSWHHHDRQTSNGVLHCHWVGYLPQPHPCSHPQQTSYVHGVSTLCPKTPWTWFEMESAQHVKGKSCHFRSRSQQFSSEICDCGWDLGPSLPTSDYYLFLKMKKEPRGHNFARDDVINAVDNFLRNQNSTLYTEEIHPLHDCWTKCVNVGGDYVDVTN